MADSHANSPDYQNCPAADIIHPQDSRDGEDKFEDTSNTRGEQGGRVCAEMKVLEDLRTENSVKRWTSQGL